MGTINMQIVSDRPGMALIWPEDAARAHRSEDQGQRPVGVPHLRADRRSGYRRRREAGRGQTGPSALRASSRVGHARSERELGDRQRHSAEPCSPRPGQHGPVVVTFSRRAGPHGQRHNLTAYV